MTAFSLKKVLLPSVLLAGTVFSSLTLPLVLSGSEPVVVQLKEEPLFVGSLKDIAAPYIGIATLLSLGTGLVSLSVAGWQSSSQRASQNESKVFGLQQQLKEKQDYLEELLMSEPRLQAAGLSSFLDEEVSHQSLTSSFVPVTTHSLVTQHSSSVLEPAMLSTQAMNAMVPSQIHLQESVVKAPSHPVQSSIGFAYADQTATSALEQDRDLVSTDLSTSTAFQVKQLQDQLKQIVTQVEQLQSAL